MQAIANHGCHIRYHHDEVGVNSRLDSIQAAVLDAKLPHLNEYIAARQKAAAYYDKAFADNEKLLIPGREPHSTHVFHQYTLRVVGADRSAWHPCNDILPRSLAPTESLPRSSL